MNDRTRRGPRLIEDGLEDLPPVPASAAEAPDIDALPLEAGAATAARIAAAQRGSLTARLFWTALVSLMTLALGLWFWETVEALIARNVWLGRVALGLSVIVGATLVIAILRELAGLSRLRRIDDLRDAAVRATATRDRSAAQTVLLRLQKLYGGRADLAAVSKELLVADADIMDGDALVDTAERRLMSPLDSAAEAVVRRGARDVAAATALIPVPLIDVLAVLSINLRMIRQIATIYGGRAGWLGSWRLLRSIAAHLVTAGAIAVGEDLIGPALGGSVLSKLSRRFGEGLVNGGLTARIGVAAIEVCRPLPFRVRPRPNVAGLVRSALTGLLPSGR
jgi:putative membrane protein